MKREAGFVFLALLFVIVALQMVSAVETTITVYTFAGHTALINILDPSSGDALQTFQTNATDDGTISVTWSSGTRTVDIVVIIRNSAGKIARNQKFTGYTTGSPLSFDLRPDPNAVVAPIIPVVNVTPVAPVVNLTNATSVDISDVVNTTTNSSSSSWKMPSLSIKWNAKYTQYVYYLIYAVIAVVVIWLLIKFMPRIISSIPKTPSGPVTGKSTAENYRYNTKTDRQLAEAERKIKEAQSEIDRIRNKKRIVSEAERKFQEAKRELERVKDY